MSNICSNDITISGDGAQLDLLYKKIIDQDPQLLRIMPNFSICSQSDYCIQDPENIFRNERGGDKFLFW
jgi:hypothetical protein